MVEATATAAVAFLILCNPRRGILILLILYFFFPGKLISILNLEYSFDCNIFFIQN